MVVQPEYGSDLARSVLNGLQNYAVVTQPIPWEKWSSGLTNPPSITIICENMEITTLEQMEKKYRGNYSHVVGLGGGVACDTGKFLALRWGIPLITIPSIISVDAFLCPAVGIREDSRVRYIEAPEAERIIIDYSLLRTAPKYLNYAGVGDVLSCTTALGDWKISASKFGDPYDEEIFQQTVSLITRMFNEAEELHNLTDRGFKILIDDYLLGEVDICDIWGNARPEEGSEHFLAYTIEKLFPRAYLHGALVSLCVLIVLKLQHNEGVFPLGEVLKFLNTVGVRYFPAEIGITKLQMRQALEYVPKYTKDEKLFHGLWYLENPFNYYSIDEILDWVFSLD